VLNFYDNASGFFPEIALQKRSGIGFAKKLNENPWGKTDQSATKTQFFWVDAQVGLNCNTR